MITVERPGLLTTVQDEGRWGYQALGVPVAGPMDPWSARVANRLVGNGPGAALLEVTLAGPTLQFHFPCLVGIAGAEFEVLVGERPLSVPGVAQTAPGDRVVFGPRRRGCRAYLAVAGGLDVPQVLGSRSTHVRAGLGGRPLRAGDRLRVGAGRAARPGDPASAPRPGWTEGPTLRIVAGTEDDAWGREVRTGLCSNLYRVSPASDRMGYRLEGPTPWPPGPSDLVSTPTVTGAVQIPPGGRPILLMADRQTTGGYAIAAVVCRADVGVAGQLAPGDEVQFTRIALNEARLAASALERQVRQWEAGGR